MVNHLNKTSRRSDYQHPNTHQEAAWKYSSSMSACPAGGAVGLMKISKPQKLITLFMILLNRSFIYDPLNCTHASLFSIVQFYRHACAHRALLCRWLHPDADAADRWRRWCGLWTLSHLLLSCLPFAWHMSRSHKEWWPFRRIAKHFQIRERSRN